MTTTDLTQLLADLEATATEVADLTISYGKLWRGFERCGLMADRNEWLKKWREIQATEKEIDALIQAITEE